MKNKKTEANISMVVSKNFQWIEYERLEILASLMDEPVDGRFFPMRVCGRGVLGDRLVYETGGFYDER